MRTPLFLFVILALVGCTNNDQASDDQSDRLELVPEPDKELKENGDHLAPGTTAANGESKEYLSEALTPIREKLNPLLAREQWTAVGKRKVETEGGNGAAEYYFLDDQLQKITLNQNTKLAHRYVEYYCEMENLFFAFEQRTDSLQLINDPEYYEPFQESLFFSYGELIRIKSNMDGGAPFAETYRMEEGNRINSEFNQLLNLLGN